MFDKTTNQENNIIDLIEDQSNLILGSSGFEQVNSQTKENTNLLNQLANLFKHEKQHSFQSCRQKSRKREITIKKASLNNPETEAQSLKMIIEQLRWQIDSLKNQINQLHKSYQMKIEQENRKTKDKIQFFCNLIEQIHRKSNEELIYHQNIIAQYQNQKQEFFNIQNKMSSIEVDIEAIIKEAEIITKNNQILETELHQRDLIIQKLQEQINREKEKLQQSFNKIDQYEKLKLKAMKHNRDIIEILEQTQKKILDVPKSFRYSKSLTQSSQYCQETQEKSRQCSHCRLLNLQSKYQHILDQQ